jgi:hypothetical protein
MRYGRYPFRATPADAMDVAREGLQSGERKHNQHMAFTYLQRERMRLPICAGDPFPHAFK